MAEFVTATMVRDYLQVTGTTGQWSASLLGSNIAAASGNLQRWTGRQFEPQGSNTAVRKTFTTNGRAYLNIPDLRSATEVSLNGSALSADETYNLIPDRANSGVYIAIQLPQRRSYGDHRSYHDWFDRNLDHPRYDLRFIPNDLAITGFWGWVPYPPELELATKVLAAYYTKRPEAVLGGITMTSQGNEIDLSQIPREVKDFVRDWTLGDMVG